MGVDKISLSGRDHQSHGTPNPLRSLGFCTRPRQLFFTFWKVKKLIN